MAGDSILLQTMSRESVGAVARRGYGDEDIVDEADSAPLIESGERGDEGGAVPAGGRGVAGGKMDSSQDRVVTGLTPASKSYPYASNAVSNAKYNPVTFLPIILYEQFKFFFNLYFLLVALSQAVPQLRIGYLSSYVVPLAFVLAVTIGKEAWDDILRRRRDRESNSELYEVVDQASELCTSRDLRVGHVVKIHKNQRVPADMVLLYSDEPNGECFIRTDQLDGETDWKLRIAATLTQSLPPTALTRVSVRCGPPEKDIHKFVGTLQAEGGHSMALSVDNTMWANTVLASGSAYGMVVYTGRDTRMALNTSKAGTKVGLLELEINNLSKILCACVFILSIGLVAFEGFGPNWYINIMRFLILFSSIIPVSLRVNLDLGKSVYAYQIEHDKSIPDTIVRTSTIPEDLGRIEYLLSDKTGTLTQNEMEMRKVHIGTVSYGSDAMEEVAAHVAGPSAGGGAAVRTSKREIGQRIRDVVTCLAVCHSVTPTYEDGLLSYQASSPDEVAIVKWTAQCGLELRRRDRHSMTLYHRASNTELAYDILHLFPFNSDNKRMGIVVRDTAKGDLWFFQKGADTVMAAIVQHNDWLEEEVGNMAREGLRTLVVGRKKLSPQLYATFADKYKAATEAMVDRDARVASVIGEYLEHDLELLGVTGVEDRLQTDVKPSLELLRNAGIKIWMLTGDKVETARCVAVSSRLVARGQYIHTVTKLHSTGHPYDVIEFLRSKPDSCLLIDGESLQLLSTSYRDEFLAVAVRLPAVIACRCTPQQKADMALLIRRLTKKRVCCIGDGGNDVSMIQAADVGVGIVGKEGRQASLAADFSVLQFCYLTKLLVWHGRNSYKRSAKLAQFVIHRGLIISVCQTVYSIASRFEPLALFQGWLIVGYATVYTMAPVFSLVLDKDVDEDLANLYPELYRELTEGRSLSYKTFFIWVLISLYQGSVIQGMAQLLTSLDSAYYTQLVAVGFTALILNELIMVALEIITWNKTMFLSEVITFGIYVGSIPFLGDYFDLDYVTDFDFYWKTAIITAAALIPPWIGKALRRRLRPPNYAKVQQV